MAFGEIAKLAHQALTESGESKTSAPAPSGSAGAVILGQIQAMQKACKDDEELVVLYRSGPETIRVFDFIFPAPSVLVLSGLDEENTTTRVVSTAEALQLVCKVRKVQPPAEPVRLRFRSPKSKPEGASS